MEYKTYRVLIFFLSLFFLIYFGFQLFHFFESPKATQIATPYSFVHQIKLSGVVVKQEEKIEQSYQGVIQYNIQNAKKIKKGTPLATVFPTQQDLERSVQTQKLQETMLLLQEIELQQVDAIGQKKTRGSPEKNQLNVLFSIEQQNFGVVSDEATKFLAALLQQKKVLDPTISYVEEIERLTVQLETLSYQEGQQILSPKAGYFTNEIDGYETLITPQTTQDISPEALRNLIEHTTPIPVQTNQIGKVITHTNWEFFALLTPVEATKLTEGKIVTMEFPDNSQSPVRATVEKIHTNIEKSEAIVLFTCDYLNEHTINLRKEKPTIIIGNSTGIRINRQAIRMQGAQTGVYINVNEKPVFKKIQIVYSADDFVVSKIETDRVFLQLYDEIIVLDES